MKKLLAIIILGLLFSGNAYSDTIKNMSIICDTHEHYAIEINGKIKELNSFETVEISIINNQASLIYHGGVTVNDYIDFKLTNVSDREYFFENKNNDDKLFAKIAIDRMKGTALVSHIRNQMSGFSYGDEGLELKNCRLNENKPKF